jgi:MerR family transcriptional regulator, light-induced transcriptional regulator
MTGLSQGLGRSMSQPMADEQQCEDVWFRPEQIAVEADRTGALFRTVENEIIPRLMLLHRGSAEATARADRASNDRHTVSAEQVVEFTQAVLQGHEPAIDYLKRLVASGASLDGLCLNLLAPAARRLGDLWEDDIVDFTEVTIALGRLQGVLRGLSASMQLPRSVAGAGRKALFVSVPGEQHTFGLAMVCDFFRISGWAVWSESLEHTKASALVSLIHDQHFDVVGFAIGNDKSITALAELIRNVRQSSMNRQVGILVGGPLLVARPQIATLVGADATGADARQAMLEAEKLLAAPRRAAV